jgi:hypothetical protein
MRDGAEQARDHKELRHLVERLTAEALELTVRCGALLAGMGRRLPEPRPP